MFETNILRWQDVNKRTCRDWPKDYINSEPWSKQLDIGQPEECAIQRAFDEARKAGKPIISIMMVCNCKKCRPFTL